MTSGQSSKTIRTSIVVGVLSGLASGLLVIAGFSQLRGGAPGGDSPASVSQVRPMADSKAHQVANMLIARDLIARLPVRKDGRLESSDLVPQLARATRALRPHMDVFASRGDAEHDAAARQPSQLNRQRSPERALLLLDLVARGIATEALPGVDFGHADLEQASMPGARLSEARLSQAHLHEVDLTEADLRGVVLAGADLRGARLRGANLPGAVLVRADLTGADLGAADLSRADLRGVRAQATSFEEARLEGAFLFGVDLSSATGLTTAQLGVACLDASTALPEGIDLAKLESSTCDDLEIPRASTLFRDTES